MEREEAISMILEAVKPRNDVGIDIELWLAAERPDDPRFNDWLKCCTEMVDAWEAETGEPDTDSGFAEFVKRYGRVE